MVVGSFPLAERLHLTVGAGVQIAANAVPPVQPSLDSLPALSVLSIVG
jgi:hypothetical protein